MEQYKITIETDDDFDYNDMYDIDDFIILCNDNDFYKTHTDYDYKTIEYYFENIDEWRNPYYNIKPFYKYGGNGGFKIYHSTKGDKIDGYILVRKDKDLNVNDYIDNVNDYLGGSNIIIRLYENKLCNHCNHWHSEEIDLICSHIDLMEESIKDLKNNHNIELNQEIYTQWQ